MEASQGRGWVRRSLRSKQESKNLDNMHMKILEENRGECVYDFVLRKGKPLTSSPWTNKQLSLGKECGLIKNNSKYRYFEKNSCSPGSSKYASGLFIRMTKKIKNDTRGMLG